LNLSKSTKKHQNENEVGEPEAGEKKDELADVLEEKKEDGNQAAR